MKMPDQIHWIWHSLIISNVRELSKQKNSSSEDSDNQLLKLKNWEKPECEKKQTKKNLALYTKNVIIYITHAFAK